MLEASILPGFTQTT